MTAANHFASVKDHAIFARKFCDGIDPSNVVFLMASGGIRSAGRWRNRAINVMHDDDSEDDVH